MHLTLLRKVLTEEPVLAYPNFTKRFRLETDICVKELGQCCHSCKMMRSSRALSDP